MSATLLENPFAEQTVVPVLDWSLSKYIEHPAPSRSLLWRFHTAMSPYHFRWEQDNEPEGDKDAMTLGSAIHVAVLEPDNYDERVRVWTLALARELAEKWDLPAPTGSSVTRRGKIWDRLKIESDAKRHLVLTPGQDEVARRLAAWVRTRKGIRRLFGEGLVESTILANHEPSGLPYKVRLDFGDPTNGWIVEVKSTHTLDPWALFRSTRDRGYYVQAAMQLDAAEAAGLELREHFTFWISTRGAPWARLTQTPIEAIAEGRGVFTEALEGWHRCTETGEWPPPTFEREALIWEETR